MPDRTPQTFSLEELWLLQAKVRHEMAQQGEWKAPPASLGLNEQVAMAILFCEENGQPDACLELSLEDCLLLDYVIPQEAKDAQGAAIGKSVLRKAFRSRARLLGLDYAAAAEEPAEAQVDVSMMMEAFEARQKGKGR